MGDYVIVDVALQMLRYLAEETLTHKVLCKFPHIVEVVYIYVKIGHVVLARIKAVPAFATSDDHALFVVFVQRVDQLQNLVSMNG